MVEQYNYDNIRHWPAIATYGLNSLGCPIGKQQCCLLSLFMSFKLLEQTQPTALTI